MPVHKGRGLKPGTLRDLIDDLGLSVEEVVRVTKTDVSAVV